MSGGHGGGREEEQPVERRIPGPRSAPDDRENLPPAVSSGPAEPSVPSEPLMPPRPPVPPSGPPLPHHVLQSLLGAWALAACSAEETAAVEDHLTSCAPCADEALRLRDAVGLLHSDGTLDLDPLLRSRVLEGCLGRRPALIPVPDWAAPYDAETARLDALLRDIRDSEWHAPVRLKWFEDDQQVHRKTTVAGVIGHLTAVDGLVSRALGLDDPLGKGDRPLGPTDRTESYWSAARRPPTRAVREPWRDQNHALIRTVSFAGRGVAELSVPYGGSRCPCRTRCWSAPSSAGCTATTSPTRWTIPTSRPPPRISTR